MKELEREKEARRLKEFLEDYDDERDDPKYYKLVPGFEMGILEKVYKYVWVWLWDCAFLCL